MKQRINRDRKGRTYVYIPAFLRDRFDLQNGDLIGISHQNTSIILMPIKKEKLMEDTNIGYMVKRKVTRDSNNRTCVYIPAFLRDMFDVQHGHIVDIDSHGSTIVIDLIYEDELLRELSDDELMELIFESIIKQTELNSIEDIAVELTSSLEYAKNRLEDLFSKGLLEETSCGYKVNWEMYDIIKRNQEQDVKF